MPIDMTEVPALHCRELLSISGEDKQIVRKGGIRIGRNNQKSPLKLGESSLVSEFRTTDGYHGYLLLLYCT